MSNDLVFVLARVQFGNVTNTKFAQVRDAIQEELRESIHFWTKEMILQRLRFSLDRKDKSKQG
jgi:hypothetical protein